MALALAAVRLALKVSDGRDAARIVQNGNKVRKTLFALVLGLAHGSPVALIGALTGLSPWPFVLSFVAFSFAIPVWFLMRRQLESVDLGRWLTWLPPSWRPSVEGFVNDQLVEYSQRIESGDRLWIARLKVALHVVQLAVGLTMGAVWRKVIEVVLGKLTGPTQ